MRWNEVAIAIDRGVTALGIKFLQAVTNRNVGAHGEHNVGKASVTAIVDLIKNAPRRQHTHYSCFAGTCGHLAGITRETVDTLVLAIIARFVAWNIDALQIVCSGFNKEDGAESGLKLGKE